MYIRGRIVKDKFLTFSVKAYEIELEKDIMPKPGQFVMLWVPGVGEIPLSVAQYIGNRLMELVIAKVGKVTTYIHEKFKSGMRVFIRGPYGNGFTVLKKAKCLIVAGGCGLAPMLYLIDKLIEQKCTVDVVLGFKTRYDVFYVDRFKELGRRVLITTEDGSMGVKGTAVDGMIRLLEEQEYDMVYTCGKELMMVSVVKECLKRGIRVEASLERYMKCGIGICGSCVLDPLGLRVCKDGPVFSGEILSKVEDFGKYWRNPDGSKRALS
ncbi:MAG: dihydroorotate dehydrogenase electron transfer subunit [Thermoprotei archaeon]|nr:MAG: dihydroorotate dehydrogenase electron transfer subunit [Thermoprotei archaeon]